MLGSQGLSCWLPIASPAHHSALISGYHTHQVTLSPSCFSTFLVPLSLGDQEAFPTSVLKRLLPQGADPLSGRHHPSTFMSPPLISSPGLTGFQMPTSLPTGVTSPPPHKAPPPTPAFPCLCRGHLHPASVEIAYVSRTFLWYLFLSSWPQAKP